MRIVLLLPSERAMAMATVQRWIVVSVCTLWLAASARGAFDVETGRITDESWKSGVPLGGIGCGKIEIITDGSLGYYTGNHNWASSSRRSSPSMERWAPRAQPG